MTIYLKNLKLVGVYTIYIQKINISFYYKNIMKKVLTTALVAGMFLSVAWNASAASFKSVSCDASYFKSNSCNQCFDAGAKKTWEKITSLSDIWNNWNSTEQVAYQSEQVKPTLVNIGWAGTVWETLPTDLNKFWKNGQSVNWVSSDIKPWDKEYILTSKQQVKFYESTLGSSYALKATNAADNSPVWLLKFTINYHNLDAEWIEWPKKAHNECVVFKYKKAAPKVAKPTTTTTTVNNNNTNTNVTTTTTVKPNATNNVVKTTKVANPSNITQQETGTKEMLLVFAALLLAWAFVLLKRRRN